MLPTNKMLNIFYQEPDPDRWLIFDRYPRRIIRRILHGKTRPGGVMMIALQLLKGLDKIGIPYRFNDYTFIKKHPHEIACLIGKPHLLDHHHWKNPILFGAGIFSHPNDQPELFTKYPSIQKILVPGNWMYNMFYPFYADKMCIWPVGIDTDYWIPDPLKSTFDFLIYNKILWDKKSKYRMLLQPILDTLEAQNCSYQIINYGSYNHETLLKKTRQSKAIIYLCEHETQGMACQQMMATDTPVLAWDKGGFWEDPSYYPHKVQYEPVSSVPYWEDRCGLKFKNMIEFPSRLKLFLNLLDQNKFSPRSYIMENLSLEVCAYKYLDIYNQVQQNLSCNEL